MASEVDIVYAVGDVHGCYVEFCALENLITADAKDAPDRVRAIVYLGDFIDRGPRTADVIDSLLGTAPTLIRRICIAGNHEVAMIEFLRRPETGANWLALGGSETLRSYGIVVPLRTLSRRDLRALALEASSSIPKAHLDFLRSLPIGIRWDRYFFVHAGVRPGLPIERQRKRDILEIREPFLSSRSPFSHIVVHGHSPATAPQRHKFRVSLDTGCYATGRLTAARIEGDSIAFLTVEGRPLEHEPPSLKTGTSPGRKSLAAIQ